MQNAEVYGVHKAVYTPCCFAAVRHSLSTFYGQSFYILVVLDESSHDCQHTIRKQAYKMPFVDHRILARGVRYSAIPIMFLEGIHYVFITEGTIDGDKFVQFITEHLLPILMSFNYINPRSVVIMDNTRIHHVDEVTDLIERQCGTKLPPYSPEPTPS